MIVAEGFVADVLIHTVVIMALVMILRIRVKRDTFWMALGLAVAVSALNRWLFPWATLRNMFNQ